MKSAMIYRTRQIKNYIYFALAGLFALIALFFLGWIIGALLIKGLANFHWQILTTMTAPADEQGGLLNAILGSLILVFYATIFATMIGISAGVYLAEYRPDTKIMHFVTFLNDVLLSTPSIIVGLFVYELVVMQMQHFSGWAGSIALAILAIPMITTTTLAMCQLMPKHLREAAFSLGATRFWVIRKILFRTVKMGIVTGILLAVARIMGETAPLLFTNLNNQFLSLSMAKPMPNLPVTIFDYALSPYDSWQQLAWTGALLITGFTVMISILTKITMSKD